MKAPSGEADQEVTKYKNQVRGALAQLHRATPGNDRGEHWKTYQRATELLNKALAKARATLPPSRLEEFERWADLQIGIGAHGASVGTDPTLLGLLPRDAPNTNLAAEFLRTRDALSRSTPALIQFANDSGPLLEAIANQSFNTASDLLEQIVQRYDYSYWSIETQIAALHMAGKPDLAKEFVEQLSIGAGGLNRFYLYHFGLRNEASQSSSRFKILVTKRIRDSKLTNAYKKYAEYRTARTLPSDAVGLAEVLSYEHLTTRIDLLFTAIRIALEVIHQRANHSPTETAGAKALLDDFGTLCGVALSDDLEITLSEDLRQAVSNATERAFGIQTGNCSNKNVDILSDGLASAFSYSGGEADEEHLRKRTLNLSWLPDSLVLDVSSSIPKTPDLYSRLRRSVAATSHEGSLLRECEAKLARLLASTPNADAAILQSRLATAKSPDAVPLSGDAILEQASMSNMTADCLAVAESSVECDDLNYAKSVEISAYAVLHNSRLIPSLPFSRLFSTADWRVIASYGISVELCICLHYYASVSPELHLRAFKRFAIEEMMLAASCASISDFCEGLLDRSVDRRLVENFMSVVCDVPTLELLPGIEGSREALTMRAALLRKAATLSTRSSAQLIAEADSIAAQLEVDTVLDQLDESKVYVDEEPLLALSARELSADFERYRGLIASGVSRSSSLEEFMRSVKQQSATVFQIPKNEADDLLVRMLSDLLDMFINDSVNGLDSVIGRRIRHGTISHELRGTLEHLQLIGQRPKSGAEYDPPASVLPIMGGLEPRTKKTITSAFARFSQAVDTLVVQLRDEVFQTRSKGKLKPAFELSLTPFLFAVASSIAGQAPTIEAFARECFQIFWFALTQIVERERNSVDEYIKRTLRDAFSKLLLEVRNSAAHDATFLASIQVASETLQRKASTIANWIRIPRVSYEGRTYPLQLVFDVTISLVKSQHSGFDPILTQKIDAEIQLDSHAFPIVQDALQIVLDNIAQHSGVRHGNHVKVRIGLNENEDRLCFEIANDLAKDALAKDRIAKIENIRDEISRKSFADRAKRPSGSGLAKLAALVHQGDCCALEFAPSEDGRSFRVYFELIYISIDHHPPSESSLPLDDGVGE